MAKKIRFPLEMANGAEVRSLDEFREHFELSKVLEYYKIGKLLKWLDVYYYTEEAEKVQSLNPESGDFVKQLCAALGVELPEEEVDYETIAERAERLERLKQYTSDEKILAMVDAVAFDQDELYDRLDEGCETIYLCGENISVPSGAKGREIVDLLKRGAVRETPEEISNDDDEELEGYEDFEKITIYHENYVCIDFCGVEFNSSDERVDFKLWVDNLTSGSIEVFVVNLRVNGRNYKTYESLGTIDLSDDEEFNVSIHDLDGVSYEEIKEVEAEFAFTTEKENVMYCSKAVKLKCDTITESVLAKTVSDMAEGVLILNGLDKVVFFRDITFDEEAEELKLNLYAYSAAEWECSYTLWLKDVTVNGILCETEPLIGAVQNGEFEKMQVSIPMVDDVPYQNIDKIEFEVVTVDGINAGIDDAKCLRSISRRLRVKCDMSKKTYENEVRSVEIDNLILEESGIRVEFMGVEFDSENGSMEVHMFVDNESNKDIELYIKNLRVNGKEHTDREFLEAVDEDDCSSIDEWYPGVNVNTHKDIQEVEFEIEVDDEDERALFETKRLQVLYNTSKQTFKTIVLRDEIIEEDEEEEDFNESNDETDEDSKSNMINVHECITMFDMMDMEIEFRGLDIDKKDGKIYFNIWSENDTENPIRLYMKNLKINGRMYASCDHIATLERDDYDYYEYIARLEYVEIACEDIRTIEFEVEIDDDRNIEMYDTKRIRIVCDMSWEKFGVEIIRDRIVKVTGCIKSIFKNSFDS